MVVQHLKNKIGKVMAALGAVLLFFPICVSTIQHFAAYADCGPNNCPDDGYMYAGFNKIRAGLYDVTGMRANITTVCVELCNHGPTTDPEGREDNHSLAGISVVNDDADPGGVWIQTGWVTRNHLPTDPYVKTQPYVEYTCLKNGQWQVCQLHNNTVLVEGNNYEYLVLQNDLANGKWKWYFNGQFQFTVPFAGEVSNWNNKKGHVLQMNGEIWKTKTDMPGLSWQNNEKVEIIKPRYTTTVNASDPSGATWSYIDPTPANTFPEITTDTNKHDSDYTTFSSGGNTYVDKVRVWDKVNNCTPDSACQ